MPVAARRDHMRPMAGRSVVRRAWYRPCMIIERDLDALRISGVRELNAANAFVLEKMVSAARTSNAKDIELDLSETFALDSSGLGALIALRNAAERPGGVLRLVNPTPLARRILELTRLHRVLEIAQQEKRPADQQSEYLNEAGSTVSPRPYSFPRAPLSLESAAA